MSIYDNPHLIIEAGVIRFDCLLNSIILIIEKSRKIPYNVVYKNKRGFMFSFPITTRHCYFILLFSTFSIFGWFLFANIGGLYRDPRGDLEIYIKIAQALEQNTLYQQSVDTKNTGFLFFFYFFYKTYTFFNTDLSNILIWNHSFLFLLYFASSLFIFHIIYNLTNSKKWALVTAIVCLLYISILEHSYIINQPQVALLIVLYLLLKISDPNFVYNYKNYFCLGLLLGFSFIFCTPFFPIILFIPIISYIQEKNLQSWFMNCSIAGVGFFVALLPFFVYFLTNNALSDWWYWNFEFLTIKGEFGTDFGIPFFKNIVGMFFTLGYYPQTILNFIVTLFSFGTWSYIILQIITKKFVLPKSIYGILSVSLLTLITRLMLELHHSSYNIYYIPFLIICPSLFLFYYKDVFSKKILTIISIFIICWCVFTFKLPASFNQGSGSYSYDSKTLAIIKNNPHKKPTYISSTVGTSYSFSTQWKSLTYNAFLSSLRFLNQNPEVILGSPQHSDYLELLSTPNKYEQQLLKNYPLDLTILGKNYTKVSPMMYIKNDSLNSWNLDISNIPSNAPFNELLPFFQKRLKLPDNIKIFIKKHLN